MSYKIGVDGGASKTECVLIGPDGAVLARHLAKGSSPSLLPPAAARQVVADALAALLEKAPEPKANVTALLLCMAGNREFWKEYGRTLTGFGRVATTDDSLPVLELATGGQPGLVLHGGTGSFVAARTGAATKESFGRVHYAGGLGWRFGDDGSGYDLGRRAVARALLELQGWMSPSGIGPLVCGHAQLTDPGEISRYFYSQSGVDPRVAGLAPGILRLAGERDPAAHAMVVESTSRLLDLAVRVATKLFPNRALRSLRAGLSGPILTDSTVIKILADRAPLALEAVREPPIEGVRQMLDLL